MTKKVERIDSDSEKGVVCVCKIKHKESFDFINWETKELGKSDEDGFYPVLVSREEINRRKKELGNRGMLLNSLLER